MHAMRVIQIPVLEDNYSYLLIDEKTKIAAVVDPAEPQRAIEAAQKEGVNIQMILTTHHHWDHADGNPQLVEKLGKHIKVYGGDDRVKALTDKVGENDVIKIGDDVKVKVLFTPCHTTGHVLYFATADKNPEQNPALFSGDTLFVAGCGRFFEGNGEQMYDALVKKCGSLPDNTQVYCGHEYTVQNLAFAKHVDPDNVSIMAKLAWAREKRNRSESTVPSLIAEEKKYNPFMRVDDPAIRKSTGHSAEDKSSDVMDKLRDMKNKFKADL